MTVYERQAHDIVNQWFREGSNSLVRLEEIIADALRAAATQGGDAGKFMRGGPGC